LFFNHKKLLNKIFFPRSTNAYVNAVFFTAVTSGEVRRGCGRGCEDAPRAAFETVFAVKRRENKKGLASRVRELNPEICSSGLFSGRECVESGELAPCGGVPCEGLIF
jgi:hypothetical protein